MNFLVLTLAYAASVEKTEESYEDLLIKKCGEEIRIAYFAIMLAVYNFGFTEQKIRNLKTDYHEALKKNEIMLEEGVEKYIKTLSRRFQMDEIIDDIKEIIKILDKLRERAKLKKLSFNEVNLSCEKSIEQLEIDLFDCYKKFIEAYTMNVEIKIPEKTDTNEEAIKKLKIDLKHHFTCIHLGGNQYSKSKLFEDIAGSLQFLDIRITEKKIKYHENELKSVEKKIYDAITRKNGLFDSSKS